MSATKPDLTKRSARKRDSQVLDAAIKVFHERGYAAATVQDVADELGILKGSLYHYIDTKEDLLYRVCETVHAEVDQLMAEVREVEDLSALERLRLFVHRQVTYNLDHLAVVAVYTHDGNQLGDKRRAGLVSRRQATTQFVTGLIAEAQDLGEADESGDPQILAHQVLTLVTFVYRWYRPKGGHSRAKVAEATAAYALGGVIGERRTATKPSKPKSARQRKS